jgi:hypothetical protein
VFYRDSFWFFQIENILVYLLLWDFWYDYAPLLSVGLKQFDFFYIERFFFVLWCHTFFCPFSMPKFLVANLIVSTKVLVCFKNSYYWLLTSLGRKCDTPKSLLNVFSQACWGMVRRNISFWSPKTEMFMFIYT